MFVTLVLMSSVAVAVRATMGVPDGRSECRQDILSYNTLILSPIPLKIARVKCVNVRYTYPYTKMYHLLYIRLTISLCNELCLYMANATTHLAKWTA